MSSWILLPFQQRFKSKSMLRFKCRLMWRGLQKCVSVSVPLKLILGCPNHTVAYINPTTGMAQNCTNRKLCIRGFSCQLTTFGYSLCCTKVAKVATNTINGKLLFKQMNQCSTNMRSLECPQGRKLLINVETGAATECLERICPDGYKCMYSHKPSKYICCSDDTPSK